MFANRIIYLFLNFYREDSSVYSYHLLLKFWINLSTVYTLTCIYYTLQFIQSTYYIFFGERDNLSLFCCVINNRVHSIFWFQYSLQLSRGLMWYHYTVCSVYTIHFTIFCLFVWEAHFTTYFVVILVHSFFLFQYSLPLSRGLMWYHVNPHFCYYVILFIIKKCYHFFFIS